MNHCKIIGCENPVRAKGLCNYCYMKQYRENNQLLLKVQQKEWHRGWYNRNKKEIINKTSKYSKDNYLQTKYYRVKSNAKKRNIEFSISKEEFIKELNASSKYCIYCGTEYHNTENKNNRKQISVDRIDSSKGYIIGNIAVCCNLCNTLKLDIFTYEDMITVIGPIIKERRNEKNV